MDSDIELKFLILKKIYNDLERIQAQTLQTFNWNFINNINSSSKGSRQSSGNVEDLEIKNQENLFNNGFKDMAEKYYSNIQKANISGLLSENKSMNALVQQSLNNVNNNNMLVNNNHSMTPRGN
jgi:hypothetical protein